MSHSGDARARGFTLVEVLVALVVVALGMGAALAALSSAADNTARLRDRGFAQWIGFNQISATRLALNMAGEGTTSGDVEDYANARWHWQQEIKQLDTPGLYRITVKVRRADDTSDAAASWLANVTGFRGDALSAASGEQPNWNGAPPAAAPRGAGAGTNGDQTGSGSGSSSSDAATPSGRGTGGGAPIPGGPGDGRGGQPGGPPGTGAPGTGPAPPGNSGPPAGS